tara:strand:+ start:1300 stop:2019 length:720 start_codon:yes stop_codon:yes gene_type:complete
MYLSLKSSLDTKSTSSITPPPEPVFLTTLRFHGATSVLGGADYQMGQLWYDLSFGANNITSVLVTKTNQSTDVDISNFNDTGSVQAVGPATFEVRAKGSRNGVSSSIQGGSTEDSVGINGGNPGKMDVAAGNETEKITFEVRDLDPEFSFTVKSIRVTRAGFVPVNQKPSMVLTDFSSGTDNYTPQLGGTNIVKFDDFGTQDVTIQGVGAGIAGSFTIGITGADNTSYGLYSIGFNVTG